MIHELKILPEYFRHIVDMTKPFEVRKIEKYRTFNVGDELILREFVPNDCEDFEQREHYTGQICHRIITYKLKLSELGIEGDWVVLGLARK